MNSSGSPSLLSRAEIEFFSGSGAVQPHNQVFIGSHRGIAKTVGEGSVIHFSPDPEMPILHHFEDSPILSVSDVQKSPPIKGAAKNYVSDVTASTISPLTRVTCE